MKQLFPSRLLAAIVARATLGMSSVLVPAVALAAPTDVATEAGPQEAMVSVSKHLFEALDGNRAAIRRDPAAVYRWSSRSCCRGSTSTMPRSWSSRGIGARRPRSSARTSSARSTGHSCTPTAPRSRTPRPTG